VKYSVRRSQGGRAGCRLSRADVPPTVCLSSARVLSMRAAANLRPTLAVQRQISYAHVEQRNVLFKPAQGFSARGQFGVQQEA